MAYQSLRIISIQQGATRRLLNPLPPKKNNQLFTDGRVAVSAAALSGQWRMEG